MPDKQDFLARRGLTLSRRVLRRLNEVGIFAQPHVSLEHQHLARRYVVRGIESGGAVREIGRYVTFCGPDGGPLPYLHLIDAVGVNGVLWDRLQEFVVAYACEESGRSPTGGISVRGSMALCQMAKRRTMPKRPAQVAGWSLAGSRLCV
jgi:hypothetical protein